MPHCNFAWIAADKSVTSPCGMLYVLLLDRMHYESINWLTNQGLGSFIFFKKRINKGLYLMGVYDGARLQSACRYLIMHIAGIVEGTYFSPISLLDYEKQLLSFVMMYMHLGRLKGV